MPSLDRATRHVIAERYATRRQRGYVLGKLAIDPLYEAAVQRLRHAAPLPLLDVGCGMGLLGHCLHAAGVLHGYLGIDHDVRKIDAGREAASRIDEALTLRCVDAAELTDFRGHVALFDVLHYLSAERQPALLRQLAGSVAPGGLLLLRSVLREACWRYRLTVLEEQFLYRSGWMRVRATHYPTRDEILLPLREAGLACEIEPLWGRTPFNSYLIVARRPS